MGPHYYIMKQKKILRLEEEVSFSSLSPEIKDLVLDPNETWPLTQTQANWRVAIFRDEILDLEEFTEWLDSENTKEVTSFWEEEEDGTTIKSEIIAN